MAEITQERLFEALSYDPESGDFKWKKKVNRRVVVGSAAGGLHRSTGYWRLAIDGVNYKAHRLAWFWTFGVWPDGEIDHIDCDKTNNRIGNLRDVSHLKNMQNERMARRNSSTRLLGAFANGKKFQAKIRVDGVQRYLGTFDVAEQAHAAYLSAKREWHVGSTL